MYLHRSQYKSTRFVSRNLTNEVVSVNSRAARELDEVDTRIDRLTLLCETMWEMLIEHTELTEEDMIRKVMALDDEDGHRNFRRQRVATPCECGAKIPPVRLSCQFCGAPPVLRSPFDAI